jgi:hypothetical protein
MNIDGTPHTSNHVECTGPDCQICKVIGDQKIEMKPYEMPDLRSIYGISTGGGKEKLRRWARERGILLHQLKSNPVMFEMAKRECHVEA